MSIKVSPPAYRPGLKEFSLRVAVGTLIVLLLVSLAYLAWSGVHVFLEAFAGLLFAVFLSALSNWLSEKTRLPRGLALALVLAGLLLSAAALLWLLYSRLSVQVAELIHRLPQSFVEIRNYLQQYEWGRLLVDNIASPAQPLSTADIFSRATGLIGGVEEALVGALVILVVGIFGAAEPQLYRAGLLHLAPRGSRARLEEALDAIDYNLRWWLLGQIFLMFAVGAATGVGLWLIGVPLALALGVITGILEMVPYVGPWLSVIPAALISLMLSPAHLLMTLGLYLGVHLLEGYVLLPLVQRRSVLLPPALTVVAQLLLGKLLGLLGLFVAAPLTVAVVVLVKMLYIEDTLADTEVNVPGEPGGMDRAEAGKSEAS
jgi:predicted PurR-regulated permease PerM